MPVLEVYMSKRKAIVVVHAIVPAPMKKILSIVVKNEK
jgi:hypothetical protein